MNDSLIGSHIAAYRVERLLGRGGMASVYFAWDTRNNRAVALKVMDERYRDTPAYVNRFIQEAQAIASWDHLNIVNVFDAGEENGIYYYAMEFIRGMDLAQLLRQYLNAGQLMPYNEVVRIGWAMANALDFAHANGIIHRDVKPSNVLISVDGRILLSDFGLVMDINRGTMGETFGSPTYISPEQARSSAGAVPQSDIYSLGVMLYEMLIGVVPFHDPSPAALALKHLTEEPPRPRLLNPRLSPAVEAVLLRSLRKQPAERYATGREMLSALERALASELQSQDAAVPQPIAQETQVFRTTGTAPPARYPSAEQAYPPPTRQAGAPPPAGATAVQGASGYPVQAQTQVYDYGNSGPQYAPGSTSVRPAYSSPPPAATYSSQPAYPAPLNGRRSSFGGRFIGCLGLLLLVAILAVFATAAASTLGPPNLSISQLLAPFFASIPGGVDPTRTSQPAQPSATPTPPANTTTPVPPTNTSVPTQTAAPTLTPVPPTVTATATEVPTLTLTPTAIPTEALPPPTSEPVYSLVIAHQKEDGFVLINNGRNIMPLAPLAMFNKDEEMVVSGTDWEIETLKPGQCVGVFIEGSSPKVPSNVRCDPTGKIVTSGSRFWREEVIVHYNGVEVASCPLEPAKCAFKTKTED